MKKKKHLFTGKYKGEYEKRIKKKEFNPTHEDIQKATKEFEERGRKIKKIEQSIENIPKMPDYVRKVLEQTRLYYSINPVNRLIL